MLGLAVEVQSMGEGDTYEAAGASRGHDLRFGNTLEGKEPWQWNKAKSAELESQQCHSQIPRWGKLMENLGNYCSLLVQELVFVFALDMHVLGLI